MSQRLSLVVLLGCIIVKGVVFVCAALYLL